MNGNYVISVYCLIYVLHLHYTKPNWRTPKSISRTRFNIYSQTTTPNPWFRPSIPGFLGHSRNNMISKLPAFVSHSCLLLSTRNSFMSFLTMNRIWWEDRHEPEISEHALASMQLAHSRIRIVGQRRRNIWTTKWEKRRIPCTPLKIRSTLSPYQKVRMKRFWTKKETEQSSVGCTLPHKTVKFFFSPPWSCLPLWPIVGL